MTAATLPLTVLFGLAESAEAHARALRQAIHIAQEACPHAETDPVHPADAEDAPRRCCRACRKVLPA
jgi:hypothetical protein